MRCWVVALVVALGACGPAAYLHQVTINADDAVEAARRAQAEKLSPYWWTRATQYLHMSREVAGHADYQGANRFGRLAAEAAVKAKEEADRNELDRVTPNKGALAPAKDPP